MGLADQRGIIGFSGQSNIVIWDPNTQIEHFVRTASFTSKSENFEFIAPTPSIPKIVDADRSCFDLLHRILNVGLRPDEYSGSGGAAFGGGGGVSVIQSVEVGNLQATTLSALDSESLKNWLRENDYKISNTQTEWFDHYIKLGWVLTAFKYNSKKKNVKTEAIRMTFKTDQPYNPYYVPKDNWSKNAQLELILISPVELKAFVGKSTPWLTEPSFPRTMVESDVLDLTKSLKLNRSDLPLRCRVTRYMDSEFAKGATEDLFFHRVILGTID